MGPSSGVTSHRFKLPRPLAIIGDGGHAHVVGDVLEGSGRQCMFVADRLASDVHLLSLHDVIVAIGDCPTRFRLCQLVLDNGGRLSDVVSHSAHVSGSSEYDGYPGGLFVGPNAVIGPRVKLGFGVIVNNCASVAHDCEIGNACNISDGAHLAGGVHLGERVMVGVGAVILPKITVGDDATVGAGAVVTKDVPAGAVVVGNPARPIRWMKNV